MANLLDIMSEKDKETYGHLVMPVDTNINIENVILSEENFTQIQRFKKEMEHATEIRKHGLEPMNRLLFYGASGTGKTYLSKALSNYLNYYMLYVDIAQALATNKAAQNIADIFYLANKYKHCIIFFDECDSISMNRDSTGKDLKENMATNAIFQALDQMDPTNVFIAATNMFHRIDAAFKTRFNMTLEFKRPELSIEATLEKFIKPGFTIVRDIEEDSQYIIDKRNRLSYRELTSICNSAMKDSVIDGTFKVRLSDVYQAVQTMQKFNVEIAKIDPDGP